MYVWLTGQERRTLLLLEESIHTSFGALIVLTLVFSLSHSRAASGSAPRRCRLENAACGRFYILPKSLTEKKLSCGAWRIKADCTSCHSRDLAGRLEVKLILWSLFKVCEITVPLPQLVHESAMMVPTSGQLS